MGDLYVIDFGGDADDRARREAERAAQRAQIRSRYARRVIELAGLDEMTADLVMAALFDHHDAAGRECVSGNHPRLPEGGEYSHDAGFDCPCTWDTDRRASEAAAGRRAWEEWRASPEALAIQAADDAEQAEVQAWLAGHAGVEATLTCSYAPEQWEGVVDGRSFYFRERHGSWRLELDLEPTGDVAQRLVRTGDDGELITEPVEIRRGQVIAEGVDTDCGTRRVEHLAFIVDAIRDHITGESCAHPGAHRFCPHCGARILAE